MNLHVVRPGMWLHWPPLIDPVNLQWLVPGDIVDLGDPFTAMCAKGQEYKLDPAPEAKAATPVDNARFLLMQREFNAKAADAEGKAATSAAPAPSLDPTIPKPDPRPKKEEKKHGTLASAVSQGDSR